MWLRTFRSFGGDAVGVVVGTEVEGSGGGVRKQLPDDPQDGAGNRDQGLILPRRLTMRR